MHVVDPHEQARRAGGDAEGGCGLPQMPQNVCDGVLSSVASGCVAHDRHSAVNSAARLRAGWAPRRRPRHQV